MSIYLKLRDWQESEQGRELWEMEMLKTRSLLRKRQPHLIVQIEGVSYLDQFPRYGYYYHVSESADQMSPAYSVEAEAKMLPFADRSVDLLVVGHAFELGADRDQLFAEFDRVLSVDGVLLIHAWVGYWLSATMPSLLHPISDLSLQYMTLTDLNVAVNHFHWKVSEKLTWVASPSLLKVFKNVKQQMIQPMSLVIEREDLAFVGPGVLNYD